MKYEHVRYQQVESFSYWTQKHKKLLQRNSPQKAGWVEFHGRAAPGATRRVSCESAEPAGSLRLWRFQPRPRERSYAVWDVLGRLNMVYPQKMQASWEIVLILILLIHWKIRVYLSALRYSYYFKGTDYIACGPILGRIQGGASVSIAKLLYFSGLAKVFGVHIFSSH